ncbi:unnamed protein product [Lasius platythorax]|uniref:KIF-binding protein n=1 Tax=Lasius platythorax TaxID=488582 RepID=A0AAV2NYD5_9HYME
MWQFLKEIMEDRIEQILKSEKEREANTSENAESINVSETFLIILKSSFEAVSLFKKDKISNEAKKRISTVEVKMNDLFQNIITYSTETGFDDIIVLAIAYHNLGFMYLYKEHNFHAAKDHFVRCIELLKGKELDRKAILTAINALYDLHNVWKNLQKLENCYPLLDKAMELYLNYTKEEDEYPDPIYIPAILYIVKERNLKVSLINLHKLILECIVRLYELEPADKHKFVIYVHNLLNKQVTKTIASIDKRVSIYWAKASFQLCSYLTYHDRFFEAKIHLAAADYMMGIHYTLMIKDQDYSASSAMHNNYELYRVNIALTWGTYGILLLNSSKKRLLQCESDKSCEANNTKSESPAKFEEGLMKPLIFVDLEIALENIGMPDTYVSSLDDAKIVFANVLKLFNKAKTYYTAEKALATYVEIIINISTAYKYYADFVGNISEQIKITKERIKVLEDAVSIVFVRCNTFGGYYHCRKLYFHLAVAYSTLLDMTFEKFYETKEITDEMRMENKRLMKIIIDNFQRFLKTTIKTTIKF